MIIALGASTGGTQALEALLRDFPADAPGTVVVQHLPDESTRTLAAHLDAVSTVTVREARDGDALRRGEVLLAPGGRQLTAHRVGKGWVLRVREGPLVHHHCPSVDVLFESIAAGITRADPMAGQRAAAALLTGMGADGARGLRALRVAGAFTIAQDEATSVVYGMPREAVTLNAAADVLPLEAIASALLHAVRRSAVRA